MPSGHSKNSAPGPVRWANFGAVLVAVAGVFITVAITLWLDRVAKESGRRVFKEMVNQHRNLLDQRFESLIRWMAVARELGRDSEEISSADWEDWFNRNLKGDFNELVTFGYCTAVRPGELPAHEAGIRGRYSPGYRVHRRGAPVAAADAPAESLEALPLLLPVTHLAYGKSAPKVRPPLQQCLGDDQLNAAAGAADPGDARATLRQAIQQLTHRATGVVQLEPATATNRALRVLQIYMPVYRARPGKENPTNLAGVIFATVDLRTLAQGYFGETKPAIGVDVSAGNFDGTFTPLYSSAADYPSTAPVGEPLFRGDIAQQIYSRPVKWKLWSTPRFEDRAHVHWPWVSAGVGLLFTGLVTGLVHREGRSRRAESLIAMQLRGANDQLAAVNHERERLSRDLHDGTIQSIYALGLELQRVRRLIGQDPEAARTEITRSLAALNAVVGELREFILQTEPAPREHQSLDTVFPALVDRLRRTAEADITLDLAPGAARLLPPRQVVEMQQIVREAVTNSLRHGRPSQIGISLSRDGDDWRLTVADNGTGFDPARPVGRGGHGLANLHFRAAELGGECQIVSAPGTGTAVRVIFPALTDPAPAEDEPGHA